MATPSMAIGKGAITSMVTPSMAIGRRATTIETKKKKKTINLM
jgi:hypothetical protein